MPRRPSLPSEKIMAVAGIYKALGQELHSHLTKEDVRVQVALLDAAVAIGLSTDTKDMGIIGTPPPASLQPTGSDGMDVVGDAIPCDDCGALPGEPHDMGVEH